jgi:hypothetical protein
MQRSDTRESSRSAKGRRWVLFSVILQGLLASTLAALAQTRPSFADLAGAATRVTDVGSLVTPFHDACRSGNEFEQRRCLQTRPGLQAAIQSGVWRADIEDEDLIDISRYDFERHQFEVSVRGVVWRGTDPPIQSTEREIVLATGQTYNATLQQPPMLRRPVVISDEGAAEAWRNRNTADHLVVSIVFRVVGVPWVDRIDPDGMSPRTRLGMTMRPTAIQVRNRESGEIVVEAVLHDASGISSESRSAASADANVSAGVDATAPISGPPVVFANDAGSTSNAVVEAGAQVSSSMDRSAIAGNAESDPDLTSAEHWVRPGVHQTLAASIAARRRIARSIQVDVDGDGVLEHLLTVSSPGGEDEGFVVARRRPDGWVATLLTNIVQEGFGLVDWRETLLAGQDRYIQLWQHYDRDIGGECVEHSRYILYRARADGGFSRVYAGETSNCAQERWTLVPRPDGSILVASSDRRFRLLRWSERRAELAPGPWTRRPPR